MDELLTDVEALRQSLSEPGRFEVVYGRHMGVVHRYLRWRVGEDAAQDLTAEVFVRAFRGRARYDLRHDTALPWLLGIASNLIGDHRRAERRRLATIQRLVDGGGQDEIERETCDLSAELVHALRQLSAKDRDALLLVVWGELSYAETARALDVPVGTVRSRIARARERLRTTKSVRPAGSTEVIAKGEPYA
jgi:RNA polymerase sigma-70 factor (ECF subfamily)